MNAVQQTGWRLWGAYGPDAPVGPPADAAPAGDADGEAGAGRVLEAGKQAATFACVGPATPAPGPPRLPRARRVPA